MKTLLHSLIAGLVFTHCGAAEPKLPDEIARYYADYNELTMLDTRRTVDAFAGPQALTLAPPSPDAAAAATLRKRLHERRLAVNPRFSPKQRLAAHEAVFLRPASAHLAKGRLSVECEVYQAHAPVPSGGLAPFDFSGMRLLRRETQQWHLIADQWLLYGSIQRLGGN